MRCTDVLRALARDERGSVSAEGVIVAVFLAIVFGAVLWAQGAYRTWQVTEQDVRRRVWPEAAEGCFSVGTLPEAAAPMNAYRRTSEWIDLEITRRGRDEVVTQTVGAQSLRTARRPEVVGGGTRDGEASAELICNTRPTGREFDLRRPAILLFCEVHPNEGDFAMEWEDGCDPSIP